MPGPDQLLSAAERLHAYLVRRHVKDGLLRGPDAGVRFNLRLWRFLKSPLRFIPWHDDYVFLQAQGYWILANWMLHEATGSSTYRELATSATEAVLRRQTSGGYWRYPLPERRHLVATVEGDWGAAGLLASYARDPHPQWLLRALRWYDYLTQCIGFQQHPCGKAINYFDKPRGKVPNNSVEAAWLFARLWSTTGDERFLEHVEALLEFLASVQMPNGELPYIVEGPYEKRREHYLCFQYNAFQFLELAWLDRLRPGTTARRILPGLARFLESGVLVSGASAADCSRVAGRGPEVNYYSAVLAAALYEANKLGLVTRSGLSDRCYRRVLERQKSDGGFSFSTGDYGFLNDRRSYPRPLAMILFHLLYGCGLGDGFPASG